MIARSCARTWKDAVRHQRHLNNAIGVPLMLLRLRSHHRYAVIRWA